MKEVCGLRMNGEEEEKLVYRMLEVGHGRANILTLDFNFYSQTMARPCHPQHGPCQPSGPGGFKNFQFFRINLDNYLQKHLKQRKTKQKRLNAWVASHEALF
jgi:hypothetical protein